MDTKVSIRVPIALEACKAPPLVALLCDIVVFFIITIEFKSKYIYFHYKNYAYYMNFDREIFLHHH